MTIFDIYKNAIQLGRYNAAEMESKIESMYASDRITADERVELLRLCDEGANDVYQLDIVAKLAELEERIARIESAGVVVWTSGHTTNKGETVLYSIEGAMRYCRYDGGRSYTTLAPGKINGWVVLESIGGKVIYTIEKDSEGNIILVPVDDEPTAESGE